MIVARVSTRDGHLAKRRQPLRASQASRWVVSENARRLMNCVLIAMGLYSSISMLLALSALDANSGDISNSFDNWVSRPRAPLPAPGAR